VNTVAECTLPEKILLAAHELEEQGQSSFGAEALIVGAWRQYPRTFGLRGFEEQHPDSNKVLASIMGEKGLARRGWLVKVAQKRYALTREGRQVVRRLLQTEDEPSAALPVQLPDEHERLLQALLSSTACHKFREGSQQELKFADACRFWDLTESSGPVLDARLARLRSTLDEAERLIGFGSATLTNGRCVSAEDLELLSKVHGFLLERFAPHLTLLRKRAERR